MSKRRFVFSAAVSEYLDKDMPPLPGVRRDADRLRSTLTNYADGGVHRIVWLPDGKATKQGALNGLREIAEQAGATDQVIVYFGGHGWRERDVGAKCWKSSGYNGICCPISTPCMEPETSRCSSQWSA